MEFDSDVSVLSALLMNSLPFDPITAEAVSPSRHGFAWAKAVELDKYEPAVCDVLAKYPSFVQTLARSVDQVSQKNKNKENKKIYRVRTSLRSIRTTRTKQELEIRKCRSEKVKKKK